jgi:predicted RND superfamily exporter protein
MKTAFAYLGRIIADRPYLVAGLVVSLLVFSLYGASSIAMETGLETFVDADSPKGCCSTATPGPSGPTRLS